MSVFRIGITPDFYTEAKGRFESTLEAKLAGATHTTASAMAPQPNKTATAAETNRFDAIFALGLKFGASSVEGVDRTAVIARWGVGYDMIDTEALTRAGIALAITPNAVKRPVAEAIYSFIFALTTNLLVQDKLVRNHKWRGDLPALGRNIRSRVLGSLGCGNIAREMFRMAQSLGFSRLIACDPFVDPALAAELNVELVSIETLFAESDFLAVNVFLNASTKGLVNGQLLRTMKPTAYLINTARGPIVDEQALIEVLQERIIAGAGLDVFETEPLPESPLRDLDNVILAPHGLAWTEEIARDNTIEACDNIIAISKGDVPPTIVNRDVLRNPVFLAKLERFKHERSTHS